jgi:CheY-like chemotaxis protein
MKFAHSILVLKREPSRLNNIIDNLTQAGYAIVATSVADEAIEHAARKAFPLVLVETEFLASVVGLLGVLRRADALSSIVVVTQDLDLNSVIHSIRLRIADVFSYANDGAEILGRVRSLLPAIPVVVTQLNKQIDQLSGEKLALEERLRALAGEFELWQKTVSGAITCATAHISGPGSTTAPSTMNQTEVLELMLGANPGAMVPATPAEPAMADAASGGMRLKPLIDFIAKQAGGGTAGQLAVYHVFLKVPLNLLHAAKIRSLQLVDETFEVNSPHLIRIILATVRETLGVEYMPGPAMAGVT